MSEARQGEAPWIFYVKSASGEGEYTVNALTSTCTCRDDIFRCAPKRRANQPFAAWPSKERTICSHQTQIFLALGRKRALEWRS